MTNLEYYHFTSQFLKKTKKDTTPISVSQLPFFSKYVNSQCFSMNKSRITEKIIFLKSEIVLFQ